MSSSSSSSSFGPSSSSSSFNPPAAGTGDSFSASEWTEQTMWSDLLQQKGLLIGAAAAVLVFLFFRSRSSKPEEKAARRLVRNFRNVDDADDVRDLLGSNLPTIIKPALLIGLAEVQRQVELGFQKLEREINRL
jgi:hypothetical protein